MIKTIDCSKSSHITGLVFDDETKILRVEYSNGTAYNFADVTEQVITGLETVESKGRYLNQCVYGFFKSEKVVG